jgi:hypothetical protein
LTSLLYRASRRKERIPLSLASAREAGHVGTYAKSRKTSALLKREADMQELLRMNDDTPWERSFQFRPFAFDLFGAYGMATTDILQQLARKRSEHTSMTASARKGAGLVVPQRRAADRERADVVIDERFRLHSFPPISTTRISEQVCC